jgi:hypothetical protein
MEGVPAGVAFFYLKLKIEGFGLHFSQWAHVFALPMPPTLSKWIPLPKLASHDN